MDILHIGLAQAHLMHSIVLLYYDIYMILIAIINKITLYYLIIIILLTIAFL